MDKEFINYLKTCKLFSSLNEADLPKIAAKISSTELRTNDILFYQGAPSDNVFLLIRGEMIAILTLTDNTSKILGHIEPGETAGEIGALTGEPRSLTIRATKECTLLRLSNKDFIEICYTYPAVMYATVHPVVTRSESMLHMLSLEKPTQHIALVPANSKVSQLKKFATKFLELADKFENLILISDFQEDFYSDDFDQDVLQQKIHEKTIHKKKSQKIVYLVKSLTSPLATICLKKADVLYVIADGPTKPKAHSHLKLDKLLLSRIDNRTEHLKSRPELIALHPEGTQTPTNTASWLDQTKFNLHHHVRVNSTRDYHRLLRFIRGKAVGLVLGGGGTRGWAHLGALKALEEEKIPIDIIGGTSVGAIVGACYAMSESYDESYQKFQTIIDASRHSVSWRSLTWPVVSLFDAKNFTNSQLNVFAQSLIEDTWLPYFCISSNLANYTECVHRRGLIWEKTRASSSMPGLIPPMVINGELHLDGGLLNNLPVDVMRQYIGKTGKIIAIELNSSIGDKRHYQFPPIFTFQQALLARLRRKKDNYRLPRFLDIFMRGVLIGSSAKTRQNSLVANTLVNVNLNKFRLLHANQKQADKMIELGYLETKAQLEQKKD
jgi:NTE family protein